MRKWISVRNQCKTIVAHSSQRMVRIAVWFHCWRRDSVRTRKTDKSQTHKYYVAVIPLIWSLLCLFGPFHGRHRCQAIAWAFVGVQTTNKPKTKRTFISFICVNADDNDSKRIVDRLFHFQVNVCLRTRLRVRVPFWAFIWRLVLSLCVRRQKKQPQKQRKKKK